MKFKSLKFFAAISKTPKGNNSFAIYKDDNKFYVADVVPSTRFQEYYVYKTNLEKIENFLKNKDNSELKPTKKQFIHQIHTFDNKVIKACRYENFDGMLSFSDEYYECEDEEFLTKYINKQKQPV